MSFAWPRPREIAYRLIRLRRLIGVAAVLPVLVAGAAGLLGWALGFGAPGSLLPVTVLSLGAMTLHVVLFPQARAETLALSITLSVLVLAAPLAGASVLGWALLLVLALVLVMLLQSRLLLWEMASPLRPMRVRARVRSMLDPAEALARFPLRPGRDEDGRLLCGPADADGVFPVRVVRPENAVIEGLCADYAPPEGLEAELLAELEALEPDAAEPEELADFWALLLSDDESGVEAMILTLNAEGKLAEASRVSYRVLARRSGCVLEESDVNPEFPVGAALGMWLTDFATDGLVMTRDALEGRETLAIRATRETSLMMLLGGWMLRRQIERMDPT